MEQERDEQHLQIAENSKESTVCLKTKFIGLTVQVGTGFFVEQDKIVTNIHVIEGVPGFNVKAITAKHLEAQKAPIIQRISKKINNIVLQLSQGKPKRLNEKKDQKPSNLHMSKETTKYTIEGVTAFDDENDLVLLKVTETGVPLPIGNSNHLQRGKQVYIVGYDEKKYRSVAGTISGEHNNEKLLQIKVELHTEQIDGYSGGPVLNNEGEIIGVVESGTGTNNSNTNGLSFVNAIPITVLKTLITNSGQVESISEWRRHPQIRAYSKTDIGNMYLAAEKYEKAIAYYDKALQLNPNLAHAYLKRADAKDELGDIAGAIEDYDNVIKLDFDKANAYYNRGLAKRKLDDFQGAIEDYDIAIRLNPEDPDTYNIRGIVKRDLGNTEGAIEDYNIAIKLNPEDTKVYNNRGNAKAKLDDYEGAIEDYNTAIKLNPKYVKAYKNRGKAKKALGQHEEAEADFAKAKELGPDV